jgi:hypothetical protein
MRGLPAHFRNGEIVLDNPEDMPPDGTELWVEVVGVDGIALNDEERACLNRSLRPGMTAGDIRALIDQIRGKR